ncbi:MAG: serine/threonine protein kinase [Acidobacteria bacterium]|nr:serine/threonine protein kinase [Acidobacteriota bacterium]
MTTLSKAGRYELLEELGRGAMGVVYRAQDPVIGRTVAVKTMRLSEQGTGLTREELISRFQTEAHAAGRLTHPNIVVVYDAGEEEGLFYITMELVEGRSLQAALDEKQSFPIPRVLRLMEQVCSALEFAHQRNVVHRDIKPANLMLTPDDSVKITDFGTAKILQFGTAQTAHVIGTPSYMSPEQVKGKPVDGRSDLFSLGVILYELVTGEKPFPGQNLTTVIYKIINEDPIPPRELDSSVHPGLSYVITRALAKDPAARYQTCRELMGALRHYRDIETSPEATVALPRPTAAPIASGAARPAAPAGSRPPTAPAHAPGTAPPPEKKQRGGILLALVLLAIITGASYHLWPTLRDVWQRSRAARASQSPAADPAAPKAAASPEASGVPTTTHEPEAASTPKTTSAPSKPRAEQGSSEASSADAALKSRIEQALARGGLGGKVHVQVAANTVTLSGRLTPREHRQLLEHLRKAPPKARVIDHIEYADSGSGDNSLVSEPRHQPASGHGEIEILTDVLGAPAVLRGPRGRVVSECRTPCRFHDLPPASYKLEIKQEGYRPVGRVLNVAAGGVVDERIQLEALPVAVTVTSRPPQAHLFVNGEHQAETTPTTIRLTPGTYNLVVRKPGFEPHFGQVQVKVGEPAQVDIDLAPRSDGGLSGSSDASGNAGGVYVSSEPRGAAILVDGFLTRRRTPAQLELPPGEHTLMLSLRGFPLARRTIVVEPNQSLQVNITLH